MKKTATTMLLMLVLLAILSLWGCTDSQTKDSRVMVNLITTEGCTMLENGIMVEPGQDAVFLLQLESGYSVASTDYSGEYTVQLRDGMLELTLRNVQFPTHVKLEMTCRYATITYLPNGGYGGEVTRIHDLSYHVRPNTERGTNLFTKEGHTLVSWNTSADGTGVRVGLGSRISARGKCDLYAQWAPWTPVEDFEFTVTEDGTVAITGYRGSGETVVIPGIIDGKDVTRICSGALEGCTAEHVILHPNLDHIEPDAFQNASMQTLTVYDNIQTISDACFAGCSNLQTLYINAVEAPYGYEYRKESVYADKVDMLIQAQGQRKLVIYAGCSAWYNLNGADMHKAFGEEFRIVNMALNGTVNSEIQLQIMESYLEPGDVLLHTVELSSPQQMMTTEGMRDSDDKLWCGLEYNYDLVALVDLRTVSGEFDSWCAYLTMKTTQSEYSGNYMDEDGNTYLDSYGCASFYRNTTAKKLADSVYLDPSILEEPLDRLCGWYQTFRDRGVTVYLSYACVNMDQVPEDQRGNVEEMDRLFKAEMAAQDGPVVISDLHDYLYEQEDFYDTNYHLLTAQVRENTALWIRDLKAQFQLDFPNDDVKTP